MQPGIFIGIRGSGMNNRQGVLKMQIGECLFNYKYFDLLQTAYQNMKYGIESFRIGCHIHKDFAVLALDQALESVLGSRKA